MENPTSAATMPVSPTTGTRPRVYFIDWLRVIAVLLLFFFHSARVFDVFDPFYVKSPYLSEALSYSIVAWLGQWQMPLFFALAGMSAFFSLRRRGAAEFLRERVLRLLVPFVFGVLVIVPPQSYCGARSNAGYTGSFWEYVSSGMMFRIKVEDGSDYFGYFGFGHLWFVLYLFVIAAIVLPLLLWVREGHRGNGFARWVSRHVAHPAWWWLVPVALMLIGGLPEVLGKDFFGYTILFATGGLAISDDTFTSHARRFAWPALMTGTALCVAVMLGASWNDSLPDPSVGRALFEVLARSATWLTIVGLMGLGARHLDRRNPALDYLSEASYPLYILHQTAIVVLAYFVVRVGGGWAAQFPLLVAGSALLTFAGYELFRRMGPLRVLLGLRPKRRDFAVGAQPEPPAAAH